MATRRWHRHHYYQEYLPFKDSKNGSIRLFGKVTSTGSNITIATVTTTSRPTLQTVVELQAHDRTSLTSSDIAIVCKEGRLKQAIYILQHLSRAGLPLDSNSYAAVLHECANVKALAEGKQLHAHLIVNRVIQNVFLGSKLVSMYGNCGCVCDARLIFDKMPKRKILSWNAMIRGYAIHGHCEEALVVFYQMLRSGAKPDMFTFPFVLKACAALPALQRGVHIHGYIIKSGFELDVFVANALVAMYAKCRALECARQVFDKMSQRDLVSWTAIVAGYAQNGHPNEALKMFREMQVTDVKPDPVTVASILPAAADLAALQQGKEIHNFVIKSGYGLDVFLGSALVDMYAKCGCIDVAWQLFEKMSQKNVISWTAMIVGYGMHGLGEAALALFCQMQQVGVKPNYVTFTGILSACSHGGLVNEAWQYFECMNRDYCIAPRMEHYACMVDLLGRAGCMDEAYNFIKMMPLEPSAVVWGALLGACRIHCNTDIGECAAKCLFELEPDNVANYILLSNIYAEAGRWNDVAKVRTIVKERGLERNRGCSWIDVNNRIHAFLAADTLHPQSEYIYYEGELDWADG